MKKIALILHGWPQPITEEHLLFQYLKSKGYQIIAPFLFGEEITFSLEGIKNKFLELLEGKKPDLIIGSSFGGLLLPSIAQNFPAAKLVFIATTSVIDKKIKFFNFIDRYLNNLNALKTLKFLINIFPEKLFLKSMDFLVVLLVMKKTLRNIRRTWKGIFGI